MKTEEILLSLEAKHPGEKEYLQAVKEVLIFDRLRPVGAAQGMAVRRTPIPVPNLTATPDRHAPGRQQRQRPRRIAVTKIFGMKRYDPNTT